jgi:ABC-type multidrug transport system permease subunit
MSRLGEIRELTRVRVLLFLREPEAIFWVFVFPVVLAAVLGFAFRAGGVKPSLVTIVQETDGGEGGAEPGAARRLLELLERDEGLTADVSASREEAFARLRKAAVDAVVEPAAGGGPPRLSFDPNRSEAATARLRVERALMLVEGAPADAALELAPVTETGSRYVDFLFPGLLGMNLMGTGMWGIGFAIADVRRRKLLKRLLVTPMRRSSFFLSFILSRLVFLVLELGVLVSFGRWVLGVPFRGDVASFAVVSLTGAFAFAGLGILVASRARTIEAVSGLMNFVMMPMWLGSGVFFSYERFPAAVQPLLRLLPLTGLNDALRAVMLDGASLFQLGPQLALLVGWSAVSFIVALRIFRWE